jgi:hypothetical protein
MSSAETFANPPDRFRPLPFWSLNDRLEHEELRWQIREMAKARLAGFFMHARHGLVTPYLSEEWMECIRTCVETARTCHLQAWLYDEFHCPSGMAGGQVRKASPDFGARTVECVQLNSRAGFDQARKDGVPLLWGIGHREGNRLLSFRNVDSPPEGLSGTESFFLFRKRVAPEEAFHDVDSLNPPTVRSFIDLTHESYRECFGGDFGAQIPGIFTDEPYYPRAMVTHLAESGSGEEVVLVAQIPWTDAFASIFLEEKGYDLLPHLPSIFFRWGAYQKIRYDYWETVCHLYSRTFTRRIFAWCEDHHLFLTGHLLGEISFAAQMKYSGSTMAHYEYMGIPGIDHLGKEIGNGPGIKMASSVSEQLGKAGTLCEALGVSGWDLTFHEQKRVIDWLYVMGINILTIHLLHYSLRGVRKRECPPSLFIQQPWWKHASLLTDYVGRLGYALTRGKRVVEILVLYPIRSAWISLDFDLPTYDEAKEINQISARFEKFCDELNARHWDYHLGEEGLLEKHARVDADRFVVGEYTYDCVIIPECQTLAQATVSLLQEFAAGGGQLIAVGSPVYSIEGEVKKDLDALFGPGKVEQAHSVEAVSRLLENRLQRAVEIKDVLGRQATSIVHHHRRDIHGDIHFLFNKGEEQVATEIVLPGRELVEEWHPADGTRWLVAADGRLLLDFPPGASHLLVSRERTDVSCKPDRGRLMKQISLAEPWEMIRKERNVLVLDHCRVRQGGKWGPRLPIWKVARWIPQEKEKELRLRYEFEIDPDWDPATVALELVVEELRGGEIRVNGQRPGACSKERWIDPVFESAALDGCISSGLNEIEIVWTDDFKNRFEPVYVRGDFALRKQGSSFVLARESGESALGDLAARGYPFYAGTVVYRKSFHLEESAGDAVLVFAELGGVVYDVYLNDRHAGTVAWPPYELGLGNSLSPEENTVEIHVVGSLRNLFGPHHNTQTFYPCVEGSWTDEAHWTDEYLCEPFGLLSAPHIHLFK